jgi:hypothetical protein
MARCSCCRGAGSGHRRQQTRQQAEGCKHAEDADVWPSWACGVEHTVGHFVSQHKVAIGIGLGVLAFATGYGALLIAGGAIEASLATGTILGSVAAASGLGATFLDGQACVHHPGINGQCLGLTLGGLGLIMSAPELAVGFGLIDEPAYDEFLFLSYLGVLSGAGATLADAGQALYNDFTSQEGPSRKGLCEQA